MADLIAIGCPDERTAMAAADEARRLARDLIIQSARLTINPGSRQTVCGIRMEPHGTLGQRPR
jgi:hypothetical protein